MRATIEECKDELKQVINLDGILRNYQTTLTKLLATQEVPGVSREELEVFKRDFRSCAYTCRLALCPRASIGFETDGMRVEHEDSHSQGIDCTYPDCHFPPFMSIRAFKAHEVKCHRPIPAKRKLRRISQHTLEKEENQGHQERPKGDPFKDINTLDKHFQADQMALDTISKMDKYSSTLWSWENNILPFTL